MIPALALVLACTPAVTLTPESGPASGYTDVVLTLADLAAEDVTAVELGGVPAYDLTVLDDGGLQVTLHGAPLPGPATVVVHTADDPLEVEGAYTFDEPIDPVFDRFYAVGASLTMGVQGGVPTTHGALHSPGKVLADLGGAYLPHPLLEPGLFPNIGPGDIGPPPECESPPIVDFVTNAALEVLTTLSDPETGDFGFQWGRITPELMPRNLAIGDSDLADLVHGVPADDFGQQFLAHLVVDPYGAFGSAVIKSQLEYLEEADPTLIVCTDLYGNDVIGALVEGDDIDPARVTTVEAFEADLAELLDRLGALDAQVFFATLPRPTLLPMTWVKRQQMLDAGETEEAVDALIAEIEATAEAMNDRLRQAGEQHAWLHVVDLAEAVEAQEDSGVVAGEETLYFTRFGGLLTLDGVHFSDTGYGLVAEQFALAMNEALGLDLGLPDLGAIQAADPWSTQALIDGGLDVSACEDP